MSSSSSSETGVVSVAEYRLSLLALSLSWFGLLLYLALIVTNIVRFFITRAATTTYPALFTYWLALPGQSGDGVLTLGVALVVALLLSAFALLLLPATVNIL